jgi:DNA-binding NarL/FixJ family response regulator
MTRVGVLDDHPIVWHAIEEAAKAEPDLQYSGHGSSGSDLERLLAASPDVLVVDVRLGSEDGLSLSAEALKLRPNLRVLVFTAFGSPSLVAQALSAGASGYVLKDCELPELVRAIRHVAQGGLYVDARLAGGALSVGKEAEEPILTPREREVLKCIIGGATNPEIAEALVISRHTVKYHINNIMLKLGARRRVDLVRVANERMLV